MPRAATANWPSPCASRCPTRARPPNTARRVRRGARRRQATAACQLAPCAGRPDPTRGHPLSVAHGAGVPGLARGAGAQEGGRWWSHGRLRPTSSPLVPTGSHKGVPSEHGAWGQGARLSREGRGARRREVVESRTTAAHQLAPCAGRLPQGRARRAWHVGLGCQAQQGGDRKSVV